MNELPFDARDRIERVLRASLPLEPSPRVLGIASRIMSSLTQQPEPVCSCTKYNGQICVKHYDCPVHGDHLLAGGSVTPERGEQQ